MATDKPTAEGSASKPLTPPPPDTREGAVFVAMIGAGLVYLLLFVSHYNAMTSLALDVTFTSLIVSLIPAFALGAMLGTDISTFQRLELELARTVLAYVGSGTPPASDSPLAGVWRAHVAGAEEYRRMARTHAYALGVFLIAATLSLAASLLAGLGAVLAIQDLLGLAMLVEWIAFTFLVAGAGAVLVSAGYASSAPVFRSLVPNRWRRNAGRQEAVDSAFAEIAWLGEYARSARESRVSPAGPAKIPGWHE